MTEIIEETGRNEMEETQKQGLKDNRGIGVVEIILILVVLIGLVIIFQSQIRDIVTNALSDINDGANQISL